MRNNSPVSAALLVLVVLVTGIAGPARAQPEISRADSLYYQALPEGKFDVLTEEITPNLYPHFGKGLLPLKKYYSWKRELSARRGLDYIFSFSPIFQLGSRNKEWTANHELDFIGSWRLIERPQSQGKILWWLLWIHNISPMFTGEFSQRQGLTLETNFGDVPEWNFVSLGVLWWEHTLSEGTFTYRAGQLYANLLWGNNKYINDDRNNFFSTPLASQQGVQWSSLRGLGAQVVVRRPVGYVALGFQDEKANPRYPDLESFADGKYTYVGELGWTPGEEGRNGGKYSVTLSYTSEDASGPSGYGVLVNARQDIGGTTGLFARYGQSFDRLSGPFEKALVAGVAFTAPFGWRSDELGMAFLYGEPSDTSLGIDRGIEMYWRILLTGRLDISPNFQFYTNQSRATDDDMVTVLGLRLRFVL